MILSSSWYLFISLTIPPSSHSFCRNEYTQRLKTRRRNCFQRDSRSLPTTLLHTNLSSRNASLQRNINDDDMSSSVSPSSSFQERKRRRNPSRSHSTMSEPISTTDNDYRKRNIPLSSSFYSSPLSSSSTHNNYPNSPLATQQQSTILNQIEQAQTIQDIDALICTYLERSSSSNKTRNQVLSHRENTHVIRLLGQRKAYSSMLQFLHRHQQQQHKLHPSHAIYEYTAAISILGQAIEYPIYRNQAVNIFHEMIQLGIIPNSYTFTALFLAIDGGTEVWTYYQQIQALYPHQQILEVQVYNAAIFACSRRRRPSHSSTSHKKKKKNQKEVEEEDTGWQTALLIYNDMRKHKVIPNEQTFASLIHTCAQYKQVRVALSLLDEMKMKKKTVTSREEGNVTMSMNTANTKMWSIILSAFASVGDSNSVWMILRDRIQEGIIPPQTIHYNSLLSVLAREGKDRIALHIFNAMIQGTVDKLLLSSSSVPLIQQDISSVVDIVSMSSRYDRSAIVSRPDIVSWNTVMFALTQTQREDKNYSKVKGLIQLLQRGVYTNARGEVIRPDIISYNTLLSICDDPKEALQIIREIQWSKRYRHGQVKANTVTYTNAISVCKRATEPDLESALHLLESAKRDQVIPNVFMYSSVIWTAERKENWEVALSMLQEMKESGHCKPNAIAYDGVLSSLAKNGKTEIILKLIHEMHQANIYPSRNSYQKIAQAAKELNVDESLRFLDKIIQLINRSKIQLEISSSIFEAQIQIYGSTGRFEHALKTYSMIPRPVNSNCLTAIMNVCASSSPIRWREAISILHSSDILEDSIGPANINSRALICAIFACSKANQWNEALNLLNLYATTPFDGNLPPLVSVEAINSVIASAGRNGRPDVSLCILNDMAKNYSVAPDTRSFRSAIMACNQAEHARQRLKSRSLERIDVPPESESHLQWWEAALSLLRRMSESKPKLTPDIQTYSSVISVCEAAGKWQRALGILRFMSSKNSVGPLPNLYCFNAAIAACEKGGAWVEGLDLYERMQSSLVNVQPNFITLNSLLISLENAGQRELAANIYEDALRDGIVRPWKYTLNSIGTRVLDLHQFSAPLAKTSIRSMMESLLLTQPVHDIKKDLIIIVGKGNGSERGHSVLSPLVKKVLLDEFNITSDTDEWNAGRIVVRAQSLMAFVQAKSFLV